MGQESDQEGNVGLDTSNSELDQRSKHFSSSDFEGGSTDGTFDEERVVVGGDLRSSVTRTGIETDTVATGRSVDFDLARVGLEAGGGVFGGDSALNGKSSSVNVVLGEAELSEGDTCGNLDLSRDNVDARDLFGDCVLDLDTRVNFDEIVSALLIDQELGGTGVSVLDVSGKGEGVVEDCLSDRFLEVRGGSDLDHLGSAFIRF